MIADGTIANADISASAEIAVSKLANGTARQLLQTDSNGSDVEFTSNVDVQELWTSLVRQRLTASTFAGNAKFNGSIVFEGTTADAFETTLTLLDPRLIGQLRCLMQRRLLLALLLLRALRKHSVERLLL